MLPPPMGETLSWISSTPITGTSTSDGAPPTMEIGGNAVCRPVAVASRSSSVRDGNPRRASKVQISKGMQAESDSDDSSRDASAQSKSRSPPPFRSLSAQSRRDRASGSAGRTPECTPAWKGRLDRPGEAPIRLTISTPPGGHGAPITEIFSCEYPPRTPPQARANKANPTAVRLKLRSSWTSPRCAPAACDCKGKKHR